MREPKHFINDETLNDNIKLFYSDIVGLSKKLNYCCASNKYFSDLYNVSESKIDEWIKILKKKKHIKVSQGKKIRRICVQI